MPAPLPARPHGGVRGANVSRGSILFGGPFGRMFRALPPGDYGDTDKESLAALTKLGKAMSADEDTVQNGPDPEESGIPAAYTYFGQFIDHDLTFDPASSLQKQNDPDALVDYRTPRFDLDNVYGRGPDDQPYLYSDGIRFNLGRPLTGASHNAQARDLPRSTPTPGIGGGIPDKRAIIGDPRNDENVIISQLQGLFLRFHNHLASTYQSFDSAQRAVRWHYQWIILNDFLPTLIAPDILDEVLPHIKAGTDVIADPPRLRFYRARDEAFMPLEFSAAAYRFGHSMVRPEYQLNETLSGPHPIFAGNSSTLNLRGFHEFPAQWAIDWRFFIDLEVMDWGDSKNPSDPRNKNRTQLAYKIDTSLVNPLARLPTSVAGDAPHSLGLRNLERGWRMRLPTGQAVARAMGVIPLADADIKIGKFTGDPADTLTLIADVDPAFAGNCPLWTYVLAETVEKSVTVKTSQGDQIVAARQLGPVGGRIIAETMVGILLSDSSSFLSQDPHWTPDADLLEGGKFGLRELIKAALSE